MPDWIRVEFLLAALAYVAATTLYFLDFSHRQGVALAARWAPVTLAVGALAHLAHVVTTSLTQHACAVASVHSGLSLVAVAAIAAYFLVPGRERWRPLGGFVAPLALTFLVGAELVRDRMAVTEHRTLLAVHVTANLVGLATFLLAGGLGGLYLAHEQRLRAKRAGWLTAKLPPLEALDGVAHRLLLVGFPLLTLGIVTGAVFTAGVTRWNVAEIARVVLAASSWLSVAIVLLLRVVAGWRGRRAAYGAMVGAACLLLVVVGYAIHPTLGDGL